MKNFNEVIATTTSYDINSVMTGYTVRETALPLEFPYLIFKIAVGLLIVFLLAKRRFRRR